MVVVVIIGLLAAMASQAYTIVRRASLSSMLANNFRTYSEAFNVFSLESGYWPADSAPGTIPSEMAGRLTNFTLPSPIQGLWDWSHQSGGYTASLALTNSSADTELMAVVDEKLDDGNLATGSFVQSGNTFILILEP